MGTCDSPDGNNLINLVAQYLTWHWSIVQKKAPSLDTSRFPEISAAELTTLRYTAMADHLAFQSYVSENPYQLGDDDLALVRTLVHAIIGRFVITSVHKDSILLLHSQKNENYILRVYPQKDDFLDYLKMIGLPRLAETVLIPCNGRIIYDTLSILNMSFGGGYKKSISADVRASKAKYGIIESLPIPSSSEDPDLITLRGYIATKGSIDENWHAIQNIIRQKPEYRSVFYLKMGEIYARVRVKELKGEGIESGWFALLGYITVASGLTRESAEKAACAIVPLDKHDCIHYVQMKKKKN